MLTLYEVEPQLIVSPQLLNGHPIRGGETIKVLLGDFSIVFNLYYTTSPL